MEQESESALITRADSEPQYVEAKCAAGCGATVKAARLTGLGVVIVCPQKCDECIDRAERERIEYAKREREARMKVIWEAVCPSLYRDTEVARLPAELFAQVMGWQYGDRGLLLLGATGKSKTRCAYQLLHRLIHEGRSVRAFDAVSFGSECARNFSEGRGEDWINRLLKADVLFLDDFGKEKFTDRVESELFGIVERRTARKKPIIVTTNFIGDVLEEKMSPDRGPALVRRLREFCDVINFGNNPKKESNKNHQEEVQS